MRILFLMWSLLNNILTTKNFRAMRLIFYASILIVNQSHALNGNTQSIKLNQFGLSASEKSNNVVSVQQQQRTVKGRVTDQNGEPLPFVTVLVKGSNIGT